jgi:hypothetical protein
MSTLRVNNISTTAGSPSVTTSNVANVTNRDDIAYAQINKIAGQSFGSGHINILWDEITTSKNITLTSNQISFALAGIYQITVGMRIGTASDSWSGVNLYHPSTDTILARSYGTGNVVNDPGPFQFVFLAEITAVNSPHQVRLYRNAGTLAQATPDVQAGRAITMTILKVS